ncbi:MAG TPA: HD domain-containing phosphohydrolase [Phycisphaerales bacterium]|nr:HD domain-containing phosphohydrolase [Phycisphaerales bacterium]
MPTPKQRHDRLTVHRGPIARRLGLSHLGIRAKMIAIIALPTVAVFLLVLGLVLARLSATNRQDVERNTAERTAAVAARLDAAFDRAAAAARATASLLETTPDLTDQQLRALLRTTVLQDDAVYGAAVAFEPASPSDPLAAPYAYRSGDDVRTMNIGRNVYDWFNDPHWEWWRRPRESGTPAWTEPYFDRGAGEVLMVTYSTPFRRDGRFRGVATVDIQVSRIRERVAAALVGVTDFAILTRGGELVSSPRESDVMSGKTVFDSAPSDRKEAWRAALGGGSGFALLPALTGSPQRGWERWREESWLFYAPIRSTGWVFAAMVPQSEALAPARARTLEVAAALTVALALIIASIFAVSSLLTRRVSRLAAAVRRIATGNLDHRLAVTSFDELGHLSHGVNTMARDLKRHAEEMARTRSRSREAMIFALARLAESRDDDTGTHLERIGIYVELLATELTRRDPALDADWASTVRATAALHDIGKVGIPDAILKKPGRLTDDERRRMQAHTTIGGDTLIAVRREWSEDDFLRTAAEIALHHHEKWDGTGYPFGLAGEDISLSARIVAVADVYDALTSRRVYKPAMPHAEAARIITEGSGHHFDPRIVAAFIAVEAEFRVVSESHARAGR